MSISFEEIILVEPEYLRVTTIGKYAFDELFDFLERVKMESIKVGRDRILIDSRLLEGSMTEAERFQAGQKVAELFGSIFKVVVIMPADRITRLGELAAVNRGARFLLSTSEDEAVNWLLEDRL